MEVNVTEVGVDEKGESGALSGVDWHVGERERDKGGEDVEHSSLQQKERDELAKNAGEDNSELREEGENAKTEEDVGVEGEEGETHQTRHQLH